MSIKYKLIILTLLVSIIPLLIVSSISINSSLKALEKESFNKISIERLTKKKSIEDYFSLIADQVSVMAHRKTTIEAAENFIKGFNNFATESNLSIVDKEIRKEKLINYYEVQFGGEYAKQNNNKQPDGLGQIISSLDSNQLLIQAEFISENKEALGSKHLLNQGSTNTTYNRTHAYHHPNFREFLEEFGFYDIFIIDAVTGNIVYSVYKELDFATSLKDGPYSKSSLGELYHKIISSGKSEVVMTDYKTYFPSYDGPASFIGTPILKDSKIIAILAYQISFDRINQ
ncbi:MAG: methyl-accepting chemotaxis protein, partial [Bacteriovoracaceae bacterium]